VSGEGFTHHSERQYRPTVCDCGVTANTVHALPTCAHPGCETTTCENCRVRCECCPKVFCPDHVSKTTDDVLACVACESIDLAADELLAAELPRLQLARAIISEAQL
jgi:hypothetical protein